MQTLWTIGHSTRTAEQFTSLLHSYGIRLLIDVRHLPGSRRLPQFDRDRLREALAGQGIGYLHAPGLGGLRRPRHDSRNTAWRNASFRGYADYMESAEFIAAAAELCRLLAQQPTAIMCAEALWWRCHRALIADYLTVQGVRVIHIMDERKSLVHPFTSAARMRNGRLSYEEKDGEIGQHLV